MKRSFNSSWKEYWFEGFSVIVIFGSLITGQVDLRGYKVFNALLPGRICIWDLPAVQAMRWEWTWFRKVFRMSLISFKLISLTWTLLASRVSSFCLLCRPLYILLLCISNFLCFHPQLQTYFPSWWYFNIITFGWFGFIILIYVVFVIYNV